MRKSGERLCGTAGAIPAAEGSGLLVRLPQGGAQGVDVTHHPQEDTHAEGQSDNQSGHEAVKHIGRSQASHVKSQQDQLRHTQRDTRAHAPEEAGAEEVIPTNGEVKEEAAENDVDVEDVPEEVEETETTNEAEEAEEAPAVAEDDKKGADKINDDVKVMDNEVKEIEKKRPEIIPGEEIKPDVDIPLVISNLTNADYDVQAQQMEEIARISMDNPENAVPYIVRDVFATLIDITKADTSELASPTEAQVQARKKVIANYLVMENAKGDKNVKLPYELSDAEIELANQISPMEQAERNKEYAMYTMSVLAKIYTDEVEKQTGNIVPMTDLPGTSAIVDALRYNPNPEVKLAAIDALSHIERPEYKDELTTLFTLAQTDTNPLVAMAATRAIERAAQDDNAVAAN